MSDLRAQLQELMDGRYIGPREAVPGVKSNTPKPSGHAFTPGTGPVGEACKSCRHLARIEYAKTYLKCELNRHNWTHGHKSDVRAGDAACMLWERPQ